MSRRLLAIPLLLVLAACQPTSSAGVASGDLELTAVAGPVCPVEHDPPDPGCEPRPVDGARILLSPGAGQDIVVAEAVTDGNGVARVTLPAGEYIATGLGVAGLFGSPPSVPVTVRAGVTTTLVLTWDTGSARRPEKVGKGVRARGGPSLDWSALAQRGEACLDLSLRVGILE